MKMALRETAEMNTRIALGSHTVDIVVGIGIDIDVDTTR